MSTLLLLSFMLFRYVWRMEHYQIASVVRGRLKQQGRAAYRAALDAGLPDNAIRYVLEGRATKSDRLIEVCRALGLEFYIGPPRGDDGALPPTPAPDLTRFGATTLPHRGLAKCAINGWGKDQPLSDPLPGPEGLTDETAFYVSATGQSMIPEGIDGGTFCLVSPAVEPREGDRVWLLDGSGAATIKRLVKIGEKSVTLRGWMPVQNRKQKSFEDERFTNYIKALHPVIAVFKGEPGSDACEYVPDPKTPAHAMAPDTETVIPKAVTGLLGLPEDADAATVVAAMRAQLADRGTAQASQATATQIEALRMELTAQMADTQEAVREGLADASALAAARDADPPETQPVAVVELACATGGGAKDLSEEVSGQAWFRRAWLDEHGLDASCCAVIGVAGASMEPTLMDGAKILIDRARTNWRAGDVFVIAAPDGLVVRRAGEDADGRALMVSDNPSWEDVAWPDGARILGRVVWTAKMLVGW